ncbi:hypothetical protein PF008_g20417 [Phytophthora fragariae]|uniref:RxLR effector protein n=1 Tax=Phytophthora fragariae TaxID=53985 RepID=A0A6G0QZK0_9STRA|nr:hypothetical protein PF008_g20417 [Phytophthora fragariae]
MASLLTLAFLRLTEVDSIEDPENTPVKLYIFRSRIKNLKIVRLFQCHTTRRTLRNRKPFSPRLRRRVPMIYTTRLNNPRVVKMRLSNQIPLFFRAYPIRYLYFTASSGIIASTSPSSLHRRRSPASCSNASTASISSSRSISAQALA